MMIRVCWVFFLVAAFGGAAVNAETAWSADGELSPASPYVYGAIPVPPDVLRHLMPKQNGDDGDPFGVTPDKNLARLRDLDRWAPAVPAGRLPLCLPKNAQYRDIRKLLEESGIVFGEKEWVLLPSGLDAPHRLYFCASSKNANLIEGLFLFCIRHPWHISQLVTLASIPNQPLSHKTWTAEKLDQLKPTVHARSGTLCSSGEHSTLTFLQQTSHKLEYTLNPTAGENRIYADCRICFSCTLPKGDRDAITINQRTAFTTNSKTPYVIPCGTHGKLNREYFLVVRSSIDSPESDTTAGYKGLEKIAGDYAMRPLTEGKAPAKAALTTSSYRTSPRFLGQLLRALGTDSPGGDPFAGNRATAPEPPVRVKDLRPNRHHAPDDKVFDITPQLRKLGLGTSHGERVYFNLTQNHLTVHGSGTLHTQAVCFARQLVPQPRQLSITAQIVTADHTGATPVHWTLEKIKQSNPAFLKKYATTARSGEKSSSGSFTDRKTNNPDTQKPGTTRTYEFEVEPTISEHGETVDLRYSIRYQPTGKPKQRIFTASTLTLKDGQPRIIELGHPNSSSRTHLLILHADIITTDGTPYRERFE